MKNKMIIIVILMALVLAACGTASISGQSTTTSKTKSFSGQAELIVGILKLEGTDQAVTADQASELLPLWEVMKVLADSDTSAQAEVDAAVGQIKKTLTPSQLQTITAMKLTEQDVAAFEQGLNTSVQSSSKTTSTLSSGGFGGPDGEGPGGDDLGGILSGVSQSSASSTQSTQVSSGTSSQVPTELINALIKVLRERVSS
ncbi:MAG: hypothetical protein WBW94_16945 [Anaerolineales bacterium]